MQVYVTDTEAKRLILDIGRRLYERQYVAANDGNISVRVSENRIWVTPAGVSKGYMTENMLVCMDLEGNVRFGTAKPSSETGMHLRLYRENPAIRAVVHAHPVTATSFAVARVPLDTALMTESVLGLGVVPVTEYAVTGSPEIAESVVPFCRDYNAVLLANHGALTWGADAMQAYYRMETLECCASVMKNLGYLNVPPHVLTRSQVYELLELRERQGVFTGGTPLCAEDLAKKYQTSKG
ncbi:MAG: class II aldolase/adducin family protein [Ruminococcaceae bacterium]|nr:class II aldolase/adducin family protein [Oscillospiraceae bacterium]